MNLEELLQEAKNSRCKCRIFVNTRSRGLSVKAKMLEGYVQPIGSSEQITAVLTDLLGS